jgi:tetratricopeptide (TPR) repeat protein
LNSQCPGAEPLDRSEDIVGIFGPCERFWRVVVMVDEVVDCGFQVSDAAVSASLDLAFGKEAPEARAVLCGLQCAAPAGVLWSVFTMTACPDPSRRAWAPVNSDTMEQGHNVRAPGNPAAEMGDRVRESEAARAAPAVANLLAAALTHHRAGRLAEAEGVYQQILAVDPGHADGLHLLGVVAHARGHNELAVDLIGKAIAQNDRAASYHCNIGSALAALGRLGEAEAHYRRAISLDSNLPDSYNNLGNAFAAQGKAAEAEGQFRHALELRPDYAEAHYSLGNAVLAQGRTDEAVSHYQKAIALDDQTADYHCNMGTALRRLGRLDDAVMYHTQAIDLDPRHCLALNNLGHALTDQGKLDEAAQRLRQALAIRPEYPEAHSNLGNVLCRQGKHKEAIVHYEQAIAGNPSFSEAHNNLGLALAELGRPNEMRWIQALLSFAKRSYAFGNLAAAEIACRNILDVEPGNSEALNILGVTAAQFGLRAEAIAYLEESLRADPASPTAKGDLERVKTMPSPLPIDTQNGPTYLLIKSWGRGFWADVSHVLGGLLLAEVTGRIPVTHWGTNSLFGDGSGRDAFRLYFEPVSGVTLDDIEQIDDADYFPPKWNRQNLRAENLGKWMGPFSSLSAGFFLHRPERITVSDFFISPIDVAPWIPHRNPMCGKPLPAVCRYLIEKYLRPRRSILSQCDAFFDKHLKGVPFAAIHLRGSDKLREERDLDASNERCLSALAAVDPSWRIFLLTDDEHWLSRVKSSYGNRVVATNCLRTSNLTGVHRLEPTAGLRVGVEVMTDTYLAVRANRFIGNGRSNVSAIIALLKDWKPEDCLLVRSSHMLERNLSIHAGTKIDLEDVR